MTTVQKQDAADEFTALHRLYEAGDFPESFRLLDASGCQALGGLRSHHPAVAEADAVLAGLARMEGDPSDAVRLAREAAQRMEQTCGERSPWLPHSLCYLAEQLHLAGEVAEFERVYERILVSLYYFPGQIYLAKNSQTERENVSSIALRASLTAVVIGVVAFDLITVQGARLEGSKATTQAPPADLPRPEGADYGHLFDHGSRSNFVMPLKANCSITDTTHELLCEGLDEALTQPWGLQNPLVCFERLRLLLECLPLDSTEFALAVKRLANARHYLQTGEFGAARYELRLLRGSLGR
jgi:hypothetical protein